MVPARRLHPKAKLVPGSPGLSLEVIGLRHSPVLCSLPKRVRSQAPFLRRHYPASQVLRACPPPHTARPGLHRLPVGGLSHRRMGLPVLRRTFLCIHAVATTPAGPLGARIAHFPNDGGLPRNSGGSAPALPFSRPAQRSLTLRPAYSPSRLATLYTGGFGDFVAYVPAPIATDWSNRCRVGISPTQDPRLSRRTEFFRLVSTRQ